MRAQIKLILIIFWNIHVWALLHAIVTKVSISIVKSCMSKL